MEEGEIGLTRRCLGMLATGGLRGFGMTCGGVIVLFRLNIQDCSPCLTKKRVLLGTVG